MIKDPCDEIGFFFGAYRGKPLIVRVEDEFDVFTPDERHPVVGLIGDKGGMIEDLRDHDRPYALGPAQGDNEADIPLIQFEGAAIHRRGILIALTGNAVTDLYP